MFMLHTARRVILTAVAAFVLASCSGSGSSPGSAVPETSHAGGYALEGSTTDFIVLGEDGRFCVSEQGGAMGGTYEVEGDQITLKADRDPLGEAVGSIEGDVLVDPDGQRWVRTQDAPDDCAVPGGDGAGVVSTGPVMSTLASVPWPTGFAGAVDALRSLPSEVGGYPASPGHVVASAGTASVAFPDPGYPGPMSGVTIVAMRVPAEMTPGKVVGATADM